MGEYQMWQAVKSHGPSRRISASPTTIYLEINLEQVPHFSFLNFILPGASL